MSNIDIYLNFAAEKVNINNKINIKKAMNDKPTQEELQQLEARLDSFIRRITKPIIQAAMVKNTEYVNTALIIAGLGKFLESIFDIAAQNATATRKELVDEFCQKLKEREK